MNNRLRRPAYESTRAAALFIDFDSLYDAFQDHGDGERLALAELLKSAAKTVQLTYDAEIVVFKSYGDFSHLPNGADYTSQLTQLGCDVEHTDCSFQQNATEVDMAMDVAGLAYGRTDIDVMVLVTGDRPYVPLLRRLRSLGKRVVLFASDLPTAATLSGLHSRPAIDARQLFSLDAVTTGSADEENAPSRNAEIEYTDVVDAAGLETLHIIDEHFGQYDEIYLTPLLRKLSELLEDEEPKTVIGELEECGAVWLDRRHGFPYDYTVLVVDADHPTVRDIRGNANVETPNTASKDRPVRRRGTDNGEAMPADYETSGSYAD